MVAFTGLDRHRPRIMEAASATLKPTLPRARRQVGEPRPRRRRPRQRRCRRRCSPCMHGGQGCAIAHPAAGPPSPLRRGGRDRQGRLRGLELRRPDRRRQHPGPPGLQEAAGAGARLHREGQGRGRPARHRRRRCPTHLAEGLLRRADAVRRRRQLDDHRPGGDLRPGPRGDPATTATTTPCASPTTRPTACPARSPPATSSGPRRVARRIRTGTLGINGGVWYGADAPFGGYKGSGIGRQCGIEGLEIFTETKTVGWPAAAG